MPRPDQDQIRSVGDFTTTFRWKLIFAQFPLGLASVPTADDLDLRCESSDMPTMNGEKNSNTIRGHTTHQVGKFNYSESISLTFVETVDNTVAQFLKDWRDACWSPNTGTTLPKTELEALILLQRLNNQDEPIWEFKLIGSLPSDFEPGGPLDGETPTSLKPVLVLGYDRFEDKAIN